MRPCARENCPQTVSRPNARYCSRACRTAAWKARTGYVLIGRQKASQRRKSRDGLGVRLYLTEHEARALAQGTVPATVAEKCATKLATPAPPLPGQMDILTALEEEAAK